MKGWWTRISIDKYHSDGVIGVIDVWASTGVNCKILRKIIFLARPEKCIYIAPCTFIFGFLRVLSVFCRELSILSFSF
jgi:hypothetical protein